MSSDISPATLVSDIEACAVAWVRRRHFWDWTDKDQAELEAWLASSLANRVAYWRMNAGFDRIGMMSALRNSMPGKTGQVRGRNLRSIVGTGAATLAVSAALFLFFLMPAKQVYSTPVGGHRIVALSDGSQIELNTDTSLRMRLGASGERAVWLDKGEAYFQIKHDAAHPFVVSVEGHRVTDLGTKFLIRSAIDHLEVVLVEGRARIDSAGARARSQSALLRPGDVAVATENSVSVTRKSTAAVADALGWRHGALVFRHVTLADAAAELNRYNKQKIVIPDPSAARLTIDGTFPSNGVSLFARSAEKVFELHVERRGSEIVISR